MHGADGSGYGKVERGRGDWAVASSGVALWLDGDTIADAGVALAALGMTTTHVTRAEEMLKGGPLSDDAFAAAADIAAEDCEPASDQRGSVDYKRHLARELTHRALRRAAARALHQEV